MFPRSPQRMLWPQQHANIFLRPCQLLGLLLLVLQLRSPSNKPLQLSMLPTTSVPLAFIPSVLPFPPLRWFLVAWTSCLSLARLLTVFSPASPVYLNTSVVTLQSISRSLLAMPLPPFHLITRSVTSPQLVSLIPSNSHPRLLNTTPPSA